MMSNKKKKFGRFLDLEVLMYMMINQEAKANQVIAKALEKYFDKDFSLKFMGKKKLLKHLFNKSEVGFLLFFI